MPAILPETLPEDLSTCHQIIQALARDIAQYQQRIDYLTRRLYGRSTERLTPEELTFFGMEEFQSGIEAPPVEAVAVNDDETETAEAAGAVKSRQGRRLAPRNLRRRREEHDLPEAEKICPCCGLEKCRIGEEVSEQYDYIPAEIVVIEHVRFKYACKSCQGEVSIAEKPAQPIEKGNATAGLLAQVINSKYNDHLPLYRQEQIFERLGLRLSRKTMSGWTLQSAALLLPLYQALCREVLLSAVLHTDDTQVPVQQKKKTHRAFLWVYIGDADHPYTVYDFTWTRNRAGPREFLAGYQGYLQADAYPGYDGLYQDGEIVEVGCWAHVRRKFNDARQTDAVRANLALLRIQALYRIERQAKELDPVNRCLLRGEKSKPLLDNLSNWLQTNQMQVLPKSPLGQAISYTLDNWSALTRYLTNGRLAIDNNAAERALRACVLGRKNWLFAGSQLGGQAAALFYSLIASAKQNGVEPFRYLKDLLTTIPTHPINQIEKLFPNNFYQQENQTDNPAESRIKN